MFFKLTQMWCLGLVTAAMLWQSADLSAQSKRDAVMTSADGVDVSAQDTKAAYLSNGGRFQKVRGTEWVEFSSEGKAVFYFKEVRSDDDYYYIRDDSRRFVLAIPKQDGNTKWQYDGEDEQQWNYVTWK